MRLPGLVGLPAVTKEDTMEAVGGMIWTALLMIWLALRRLTRHLAAQRINTEGWPEDHGVKYREAQDGWIDL